ncbi:MAG: transporter [Vicinamibacterales bacterium]|nr:transporter [Vicinamibacterales bacterium]
MTAPRRQGRKALPYIIGAAILMLLVTPAMGAAQDGAWQFGSTSSFSSGTYGTDTRTDVLYTPITARRLFGDGDITLVFPFLCIWGDGSVIIANGPAIQQQRVSSSSTTGRTTRTPAASTTTSTAESDRACGIGDIVARGRYFVLDEHGWTPTIAVRAHLKVPTASAEEYLGTGEPDEGIGMEVSRTIARGSMLMVDGGYTIIGKPAGSNYRNNWWYDIGIGQDLTRDMNLSVFFAEDSAIVPGYANTREVLAAFSVKGAKGWHIQISGEVGLSDGAPDHGITFGASRRF